MATIDSLVEATIVGDEDLLLIDQGGEGKKLKKGNFKIDADKVPNANGGSVQDFIDSQTFPNVAAMLAFSGLHVGQSVKTLGYYAVGDGGGAEYLVKTAATAASDSDIIDEKVNHTLLNSNVAIFKPKNGTINLEQGGVVIDGMTGVAGSAIVSVFQYAKDRQVGKVSSGGGLLILASNCNLESILGNDQFVQVWDGAGLKIKASDLFVDDTMINVGGSEAPNFATGRNFELDNFTLDGGTAKPLHGIYNRRGQEFKYKNMRIERLQNALSFESVFYGSMSGVYSWLENNDVCLNFVDGVAQEQVSGLDFSDIKFNGAGTGTTDLVTCIMLNTLAAGLNFSNCTFENFKHILDTNTATNFAGISRKLTIERCYFESNSGVYFNFINGLTSNVPRGFTIQDCYFNDSDAVLIDTYGGGFTVKNNNIDLEIINRGGGSRFTLHTDQQKPVTYQMADLPDSGEVTSSKKSAWKSSKSNADWQSYNPIGNTSVFPQRSNTLVSYSDQDDIDEVLPPFANSPAAKARLAKVSKVRTLQHKDITFIDNTKGVIFRDRANRNDFYKLFIRDGAVVTEKIFNTKQLAPRSDARMSRALWQDLIYGTPPTLNQTAYADELNIQLVFDGTNWTLGEGQAAGQIGIGTYARLQTSVAYAGFDRPIYNVDIDEVWGTIGGSTNFRDILTSKAKNGTTAQRPTSVYKGYVYYDTTISAYVFWDGAAWQAYTHKLPWSA